jgi:hypothetical protein
VAPLSKPDLVKEAESTSKRLKINGFPDVNKSWIRFNMFF